MNTKIRTYGFKVYTIAHILYVPEDSVEYKSFQVYLYNCAYTIIDTQLTDYPDDNLFESDKN